MPLTVEDIAEIKKMFEEQVTVSLGNTINSAVTSQLKRADAKRSEEMQSAVNVALAKRSEEAEHQTSAAEALKPGNAKTIDHEQEKRFKALEAQNVQLLKRLEEGNSQREAAEKRAREESAYSRLSNALAKVKPELRDAVAAKFRVDNRVGFDDDGKPTIRVRKASFGGHEEDVDLPLEDGIAHWLTTKDAEPFLPVPTGRQVAPARSSAQPFTAPRANQSQTNGRPEPFDENAAARELDSQLMSDPDLFSTR